MHVIVALVAVSSILAALNARSLGGQPQPPQLKVLAVRYNALIIVSGKVNGQEFEDGVFRFVDPELGTICYTHGRGAGAGISCVRR